MTVKLTEKQKTVLTILGQHRQEMPLTGAEIGEKAFRGHPAKTGVREWAWPALRSMEAKGLTEKLGLSFDNARCWQITPAGRALLSPEAPASSKEEGDASLS